ncbi:hypothetical protein AB6E94_19670 [Vibrio lentus]|uniref:hypothetical protein n=1 Tax=Vibrio splendidus TaxID=29497 RepID=UPI000C852162|nr:hypothetical protein [Vibrio splendidus]PMG17924.1 hypothetical protein BCU98_00900 [Vibrio splendidus]
MSKKKNSAYLWIGTITLCLLIVAVWTFWHNTISPQLMKSEPLVSSYESLVDKNKTTETDFLPQQAVIETVTADANSALEIAGKAMDVANKTKSDQEKLIQQAYEKGLEDAKNDTVQPSVSMTSTNDDPAISWLRDKTERAKNNNEQTPSNSASVVYKTEEKLGVAESIARLSNGDPADLVDRVTNLQKNKESIYGKDYTTRSENLTVGDLGETWFGKSKDKLVSTGNGTGRPEGLSKSNLSVALDTQSSQTTSTAGDEWITFEPVDGYSEVDEQGKVTTKYPTIISKRPSSSLKVPSLVSENSESQSDAEVVVIPFATINAGAKIVGARMLDGLIGRVPISGNVDNPYRFSVKVGPRVLATNGLTINGLAGMEFYGVARGNYADSCIEGFVDGMTYIFEDGSINTISKDTASSVGFDQDWIGRLADEEGNECIQGEIHGNVNKVVGLKSSLAAAQGAAGAFAEGETEQYTNLESGLQSKVISGDAFTYMASTLAEEGLGEAKDITDTLFPAPTISVWAPNNTEVSIKITRQLNIDYKQDARRINYEYTQNEYDQTYYTELD